MYVKKIVKLMKKDEGSGLILALMTLMVLSILGASLGAITIGSHKLGDVNRDDNSAYYIAEAGANLAYEEFQTMVNATYSGSLTENSFFESIEFKIQNDIEPTIYRRYHFEKQFEELPEATVTIVKSGLGTTREYLINSVGTIGQRTRTLEKNVIVTWIPKSNSGPGSAIPAITTTVARNSIEIRNGVTITGSIHLDSLKPDSLIIDDDVTVVSTAFDSEESKNLKVYVHPDAHDDILTLKENKVTTDIEIIKRETPLDWKVYEDLIKDFPNYPTEVYVDEIPATIDTMGQHITYVTDKLENSFEITGGGRVDIFVRDSINIGNDAEINKNGETEQLQVFYKEPVTGSKITIGNKAYFKGTLFTDEADFEFGNNLTLNGLFITGAGSSTNGGGIVSLGGGNLNTLLIAPYATITYNNSSNDNNIQGIMVGDNIILRNNMILDYDDKYLKNFPLQLPDPDSEVEGTGEVGSGSGEGELIITEPGIEN